MSAVAARRRPASRQDAAAPVVAMVGAGQLARMTHAAAIALGVRLRVLARDRSEPAVLAGAPHLLGAPDDLERLLELAAGADALTFDHELVPPEALEALVAADVPVVPKPGALLLAQDKLAGRRALARAGFPVPAHAHARTLADVDEFAAQNGWPLIAKAPVGGFDGRGVWEVPDRLATEGLLRELSDGLLLERALDIELELSVIVARTPNGETAVYPPARTVQRDGMCREVSAPAPVSPRVAADACELAAAIAREIGAAGVMAVEMFLVSGTLLVNELALRPHNSGHHTIEGSRTSQFEQHLRAVLGMPLGSTAPAAPATVTVNVVGVEACDPRSHLRRALAVAGAHIHIYEKPSRPGRKLGHVTACGPSLDGAARTARRAAAILEGRP